MTQQNLNLAQLPLTKGEIAAYRNGSLDIDAVYEKLFEYYGPEMPYGTAKARDGDPYQWIEAKLAQVLA